MLIDIVFNRITYIYYLKIFLKLGTDEGSDERRWQSHLQGSIGHWVYNYHPMREREREREIKVAHNNTPCLPVEQLC